jgi:hypothetical protein
LQEEYLRLEDNVTNYVRGHELSRAGVALNECTREEEGEDLETYKAYLEDIRR